jgi:hypothetical protein
MALPPFQPETVSAWWLGGGGFLLGVAGLLEWLRPPGRPWRWVRHGVGVTAAVGSLAALAWDQPPGVWGPPLALALAGFLTWVSLPAPPGPWRTAVVRWLLAPPLQWTLVLFAAPVTAFLLSGREAKESSSPRERYRFPAADPAGAVDWQKIPWERVGEAKTDKGRPIGLYFLRVHGYLFDRAKQLDADVRAEFGPTDGMIRTSPPDPTYDCHGWLFTGGRFLISGADVEHILADNDYGSVSTPRPGDLVIYRDRAGTIRHSALVVAVTPGQMPLVESKWGYIGRYVSPVHTHMYALAFTYYRSKRPDHFLRGLPSNE